MYLLKGYKLCRTVYSIMYYHYTQQQHIELIKITLNFPQPYTPEKIIQILLGFPCVHTMLM